MLGLLPFDRFADPTMLSLDVILHEYSACHEFGKP